MSNTEICEYIIKELERKKNYHSCPLYLFDYDYELLPERHSAIIKKQIEEDTNGINVDTTTSFSFNGCYIVDEYGNKYDLQTFVESLCNKIVHQVQIQVEMSFYDIEHNNKTKGERT